MSQSLCAILEGVCLPTPFKFPGNVCNLTTTSCPYSSGKQYTETVVLFVSKSFPNVSIITTVVIIHTTRETHSYDRLAIIITNIAIIHNILY